MLKMSQINHIRDLSKCGYNVSEIHRKTGTDHKTIEKYLAKEDFSEEPPKRKVRKSILDPYKPLIHEWIEEDKNHWSKQHHTAKRIYDRLVAEEGYTGSYDTIRKYVQKHSKQSKKHLDPGKNPAQKNGRFPYKFSVFQHLFSFRNSCVSGIIKVSNPRRERWLPVQKTSSCES